MFTLAPFSPSLLSLPKSRHYPPPNPNFLLHHQTLALINPIKPTAAASSAAVIAAVDSASDGEDEVWEEEEEEVEDEFLAFEEMRKWERNKPTGFGQGKVYDTTVEEKLLEEIEIEMKRSSHEAQVVAKSDAKKEEPQIKAIEIPRGPCVRLGNLPKKKNIHRDLQAAFKGFPGIVRISPSVSGSRKTRDPVCRGFAYIELVSEEAANRFSSTYSKQNIIFGKVQKQISCEVLKPGGQVADDTKTLNQPKLAIIRDESLQGKHTNLRSVEKTKEEESSNSTNGRSPDSEKGELLSEHSNILSLSDADDKSMIPKQKKPSKKKVTKTKHTKSPKTSLSSSMGRLKIRERSVLTGVFSKYGVKAASTSD